MTNYRQQISEWNKFRARFEENLMRGRVKPPVFEDITDLLK